MGGGCIANFRGHLAVLFGDLLLAQYRAKEGSRNQSAEDRSHGKTKMPRRSSHKS